MDDKLILLEELDKKIDIYRQQLNINGGLLLVSVIGIYGMDKHSFMQIFAIFLIGFFFTNEILKFRKENNITNFEEELEKLCKIIKPFEAENNVINFECKKVKDNLNSLKNAWLFVLIFIFYGMTLVFYFLKIFGILIF